MNIFCFVFFCFFLFTFNINALDRKIIIATATKNLQSQIVEDDWPLIQKRFPNLKISLLKGKSNYLCTSALARNFSHCFGKDSIPAERAAWIILALFLNRTSGDLEKIPYLLKKWIEPLNAIIEDCRADLHCTDSYVNHQIVTMVNI